MKYQNTQELQAAMQAGTLSANRMAVGYRGSTSEIAMEIWHIGECVFRQAEAFDREHHRHPNQAAEKLAHRVCREAGITGRAVLDTTIRIKKGDHRNGRRHESNPIGVD